MTPNAVIFGCEGPVLNDWEREFFLEHAPLGFILFERNCEDPEQVRALVAALRETIGRAEAPVLIDQEGGRVARLKPGAKFMRQWRGETHTVIVLDDGFEWKGTQWRSLSAIAREITGVHWSGPMFLTLNGKTKASVSAEVEEIRDE